MIIIIFKVLIGTLGVKFKDKVGGTQIHFENHWF